LEYILSEDSQGCGDKLQYCARLENDLEKVIEDEYINGSDESKKLNKCHKCDAGYIMAKDQLFCGIKPPNCLIVKKDVNDEDTKQCETCETLTYT